MHPHRTKIERTILKRDTRNMRALAPHLPRDFCDRAAEYVMRHTAGTGTVIITTGFYIPGSDAPETDGPPGALAIGNALHTLGYTVLHVTAMPLYGIMKEWMEEVGEPGTVTDYCSYADGADACFPAHGDDTAARRIIAEHKPDLLISVERCSPNDRGEYPTMRGTDTADHTAEIDRLFTFGIPSIGIGDGGNEIGMGNLADIIRQIPGLPDHPATVGTDRLIIAGTSNWGGYGLIAALSLRTGRNLLPSVEEDTARIRYLVSKGVVDGVIGTAVPCVDGFSLEENAAVLEALHEIVTTDPTNG